MIEIEITVWQFVRLMVDLEEHAPSSEAYAAWSDAWTELDRRLEELRQRDHESYADLMMNQEVVIEADKTRLEQAAKALGRVVKALGKSLGKEKEAAARDDLLFEQGELQELQTRYRDIAANMAAGPD